MWRNIGFGLGYERFVFSHGTDKDLVSNGISLFVDFNHSVFCDWFYLGGRWNVVGGQWFNAASKDEIYSRGSDPDSFTSMGVHLQCGFVKPIGGLAAIRTQLQPGWYFFSRKRFTDEEGNLISKGKLNVKRNRFSFSATIALEFRF